MFSISWLLSCLLFIKKTMFLFFISILLRYDFYFPSELKFTLEKNFIPGLIILKIFSFKAFNLYRGMWRYTSIFDMIRIVQSNLVASFLFSIVVYFIYSFDGYSRAIFVFDFVLTFISKGEMETNLPLIRLL